MDEEAYFSLPLKKQFQFICMIRQKLYDADTKEERHAAIPSWLIKMVEDFEKQYGYKNFATLFLGSFLIMRSHEETEELVYVLNEIKADQLHLTILELDNLVDFSWNWWIEKDNDGKSDQSK